MDTKVTPLSLRGTTRFPVALLALGVMIAVALSANAANFTVQPGGITGGGGTSSATRFSLTGAIGQPDATMGKLSGGRFDVEGGLLALIALIQTPGAPRLSISLSGNSITISWGLEYTGWTLQQTEPLGASANWQASTGVANNSITLTMPTGKRFYRLQQASQ